VVAAVYRACAGSPDTDFLCLAIETNTELQYCLLVFAVPYIYLLILVFDTRCQGLYATVLYIPLPGVMDQCLLGGGAAFLCRKPKFSIPTDQWTDGQCKVRCDTSIYMFYRVHVE
jgi:hypothetical protein